MKKRIFTIICALGLLMTACGGGTDESSSESETTTVEIESTDEDTSVQDVEEEIPESDETTSEAFSAFESGLSGLGVSYEKQRMAAELIGGELGYKYTSDDYEIELYQFDTSSDAYKAIEETGTAEMEGLGSFKVYFNDGMVMIQSDDIPQDVLDLFNSSGEKQGTSQQTSQESTQETANVTAGTDSFSTFEAALSDKEITYERVTMAAEYIGGTIGYKYKTGLYDIELYQFDVNSDAYKNIEATGSAELEGFGSFPVYVNDDMVMIQSDDIPQEIVDIFNSL